MRLASLVSLTGLAFASWLTPGAAAAAPIDTLHRFAGGRDGAGPQAPLILGADGVLYGTTSAGGQGDCSSALDLPGCGTVFALVPPAAGSTVWTEKVLYAFTDRADGFDPVAGLLRDGSGHLFGTTAFGGVPPKGSDCGMVGCGTVFELIPPTPGRTGWTKRTLHSFGGGTDGAEAVGRLIADGDGILYGTTVLGGSHGQGIAFMLTPPAGDGWTETVLHAFADAPDGANPMAGLLAGRDGTLYGTTAGGGLDNQADRAGGGTVFQLSRPGRPRAPWPERILYRFRGALDGAAPQADLVADPAGVLYGTTSTQGGAPFNGGTAFRLSPPTAGGGWTMTVLYAFGFGQDGDLPSAGLARDADGRLYGATLQGGGPGHGTAFVLDPPAKGSTAWRETILHAFRGGRDGGSPMAPPLLGPDGRLYGTSYGPGNSAGVGTVFALTLSPG